MAREIARTSRAVDAGQYPQGMASAGRDSLLSAAATAALALGLLAILLALVDEPLSARPQTPAAVAVAATVLVIIAQSALPLWRSRTRADALVLCAALCLLLALAAPGALFTVSAVPVIVLAFRAALRTPLRRLAGGATGAAVLVAAAQFANTSAEGRTDLWVMGVTALGQAVVVVGLPLLPAAAIAAQRAAREAQDQTVRALAREQDARVGQAIALERAAMARELHDIAAHHLSGIAVMASAVEAQIGPDPAAARAGVAQIRAQSRAVLDDLRSLVGLLRQAGAEDDAVKTLATLGELADAAHAAGATVRLEVRTGAGRALGEGISPLGQLAAYRMVQESLTNVRRHAPGAAAEVLVDDTDEALLRLVVRNDVTTDVTDVTDGGGFGVRGMSERAELVGGRLTAGPVAGVWEVRMDIPRSADSGERAS